jgi:polyhydroxybutyrate depolymerase
VGTTSVVRLKRLWWALLLVACRSPSEEATATSSAPAPVRPPATTLGPTRTLVPQVAPATKPRAAELVAKRPYRLVTEEGDAGPQPLVVLLHGYGSSGAGHDAYFRLSPLAKRRGVLLAIPDGTRDKTGKLYWNATEACCDFDGVPVDDVAYLDAVVTDVERRAHVDPARIYAIGHSNGAFMAHVWACEPRSPLAAIVALAGVPWSDPARCKNRGVSVLQVHGTADTVIEYGGGRSFGNGAPYPSAEDAVRAWAERDGCVDGSAAGGTSRARTWKRHAGTPFDLDHAVAGSETTPSSYACPNGLAVDLWTMAGSGHVPRLDASFAEKALDFLLAHPRKIHSNE